MDRKKIISYLGLIVVAIIWGSGFIATQMAIDAKMSSSLIMASRFIVAAVTLLVIYFKKLKDFKKHELVCGVIAGAFLFLAFFSQTIGLRHTTPANNAFITAINVVIVPFLSWALMKKRPSVKVFVCAALSLVGIAILNYTLDAGIHFNVGDLLTLLCAFLFACHIAYLGYGAKRVDAVKLTFLQMATAAVLSIAALLIFDIQSLTTAAYSQGILPVLYLGLFSTCVAFLIQTKVQGMISASKTAIILSMEAVFGSLFSVLLGYDQLTVNLVIGGLIVVGSIIMLEGITNTKDRRLTDGQ